MSVMAVCGQTTVSADRTHPSEGAKSNMSTFMGLASVLILPTLAFLTPCPRYMWGQFTPGDSHHPDGHSPAVAMVIPASWGLSGSHR